MDFGTLVALTLMQAQPRLDVQGVLTRIERRYNAPRTMQIRFDQTFRGGGGPVRRENGILYLRKPGRMRWEYRYPEGKLFVSDGSMVWVWDPADKIAERGKLKGSDDLRAPLAFLMGRLDFRRDFESFVAEPDGENLRVKASPKSKASPYREVQFTVSPRGELTQINVTGQDASVMSFRFSDEQMNPALADRLFVFDPPPGARVVEVDDGR